MAFETIEEFPDYSINEDGEIYSHIYNRILKSHKDSATGYFKIQLRKDKKTYCVFVHRLLAQTFIPNPDNKPTVDHIDRNRTNNNITNLRWATNSENTINSDYSHIKKDGLHNISKDKYSNSYRVSITTKFVLHRKSFKTIEEAIIYRDQFILDNPK